MTEFEEREYTVAGHIQESGERYKTLVTAGSPEMAEGVATSDMLARGGHLLPAIVMEGDVPNVDTYQWIDPAVTSQEQMDARLVEMGWMSGPGAFTDDSDAPESADKTLSRVRNALIVALVLGLIVGFVAGAAVA